ncbi:MAG: hypothetical protein M3480_10640 [Verrucomicrobiota bacterium]|nr:hypothetical protein [Chthoniobacterales bacterium]MDQ3415405.1 hypothetical protein [Verrucomicrobiota bacterium]
MDFRFLQTVQERVQNLLLKLFGQFRIPGTSRAVGAHPPVFGPSFLLQPLVIAGRAQQFIMLARAYYKSFWADPPACTVGEPRKTYLGERSFPLILQNVHRYFLYLALLFILVLAHDVWKALWFTDPATGQTSFGLGVGTLVLAMNVVLLGGYTFGCHSLRHLVGGFLDQFSKSPTAYRAYACVGCFNNRHGLWAWMSLFWVAFSDIYIRLCAAGIWHDWRIL